MPDEPAATGAVPSTTTFPFTAGPQSAAYAKASAGTVDEHDADVDGSPTRIAENPPKYASICACVIPLTAEDENIVTEQPKAAASAASADDDPPFTLSGNTSTEPEHTPAAFAGACPAATTATGTAVKTPAVSSTLSTGPSIRRPAARARRATRPVRRPENPPAVQDNPRRNIICYSTGHEQGDGTFRCRGRAQDNVTPDLYIY